MYFFLKVGPYILLKQFMPTNVLYVIKHCNITGETEPTSCSDGGSRTCSVNADCVDHDGGFCCTCKDGYFGNGKNCLKIGSYFKYI